MTVNFNDLFLFQVVTTILEEGTQVVTATEIKTSSILVTPEPTWKIETITIQPTQAQQQIAPLLLQTSAIQIQDHQKFFLPGKFLVKSVKYLEEKS